MTTFDDRERAFETQFAREQDMLFRITARRNRLLGQWAAAKMGLSAEEAEGYAAAVIQADFEEAGDEDVVRKVVGDLASADHAIGETEVRAALFECESEARRQLMEAP